MLHVCRLYRFIGLVLLTTVELCSFECQFDFIPLAGYRYDRLSTSLKTYNPTGQQTETNDLIIDGINIAELGMRADMTLAQRWSLHGLASWGFVTDGHYHENLKYMAVATQKNRAEVTGGDCIDHAISLGYICPLLPSLAIEGLGGWSFNEMSLNMKSFLEDGHPDPTINKLLYRMRWNGPWLGLACIYNQSAMSLYFGYECHLAHWKAQYWLSDYRYSIQAFSDKRWAKNALGNVLFFDASYCFWRHCVAGFRIQYQYWIARHGQSASVDSNLNRIGVPVGQVSRVSDATWSSIGAQLNFGMIF